MVRRGSRPSWIAARAIAAAHGIGHETKVAIALYNGNEYLEAQFATFKLRGVPVNGQVLMLPFHPSSVMYVRLEMMRCCL